MEQRESEIPSAAKVIFNSILLGPQHVVATYFGTLVYENLPVEAFFSPALYREAMLVVLVKGLLK